MNVPSFITKAFQNINSTSDLYYDEFNDFMDRINDEELCTVDKVKQLLNAHNFCGLLMCDWLQAEVNKDIKLTEAMWLEYVNEKCSDWLMEATGGEADERECIACKEDFTPSIEHYLDTVCNECVCEHNVEQVLKPE
jgi:hypothetical protein